MSGKVTGEDDSPRVDPSPRLRSPFGGAVPLGGRPGSLFEPADKLTVETTPDSEPAEPAPEAGAPEPVVLDVDEAASQEPAPEFLAHDAVGQEPVRPEDVEPDGFEPEPVAQDVTGTEEESLPAGAPPAEVPETGFAPFAAAEVEAPEAEAPEAEPADAELLVDEPLDAEPVGAAAVDAEPVDADPVDVEPVDADPVDAGSEGAEPLQAWPTDAESGDAEVGFEELVSEVTEPRGGPLFPARTTTTTATPPPADGVPTPTLSFDEALAGGSTALLDSPAPQETPDLPDGPHLLGGPADAPTRTELPVRTPMEASVEAPVAAATTDIPTWDWGSSAPAEPAAEQEITQTAPAWGGDGDFPDDFEPDDNGGRGGRRVLIGGVVVGALVVLGYAGAAYATSGSIPKNTTVGGVEIGGMGKAAAEQALRTAQQAVPAQLPVKAGERTATLDRQAAGLSVDPAAEVADLTGFSLSPTDLWRHVTGGTDLPAGGGAPTNAALSKISPQLEVAARNAGVSFASSEPTVTDAVDGQKVDVEAATEVLGRGWLAAGAGPVALPVTTTKPSVTREQASAAIAQLATPALSAPLKVTVGSRTASIPPQALAPALRLEAAAGKPLSLAVDGATLRNAVLKADPGIETKAKDASFELAGGLPKVVPSVPGVTLDAAALASQAAKALGAGQHAVTVTTAEKQPELTTEKAQELGVKERVSTFSTNLTSNTGRTENLRIAARTVDGTVVLPGETFSLNAVLGERTAAKGYNAAPAISGGRLVQDFGGGVSQMATTIFNNVFFSGLQDVYHKPHSFYISRYPEGREATVDWPTVDLKWKNDSPYAVLIQANVTKTVNVSFWSTKVWDIEATKSGRSNQRTPSTRYDGSAGCVKQDANSGFDVTVGRIFKKGGQVVKRESFTAVYNAEDQIICEDKPEAKTPAPDAD